MGEEKFCPLTYATGKGAYDQEVSNFDFCAEAKCAWWNDNPAFDLACCSIKSIAIQFENITVDMRMKKIEKARSERDG